MKDLNANEIANLMISYLSNSMATVVISDFLSKVEDPGVKKMLEFGLEIALEEYKGSEQFLLQDERALPEPFKESDIVIKDVKCFSDDFVVLLKHKLALDALQLYALSLATSINPEVRQFYNKILQKTSEMLDMCNELMIEKGMHQPIIHLSRNKELEKIQAKDYLGNVFSKKRPLSATEVLQFTTNYRSIEVIRELLSSFSHTVTPEIKNHFERGHDICTKHLDKMQETLQGDELPQIPTWESEVDSEGKAPYSDRLMMFKISMMMGSIAGQYGKSASTTLRKDLGATLMKLMKDALLFTEDTSNLLIKYKMLDEVPLVMEHEE